MANVDPEPRPRPQLAPTAASKTRVQTTSDDTANSSCFRLFQAQSRNVRKYPTGGPPILGTLSFVSTYVCGLARPLHTPEGSEWPSSAASGGIQS